MKVFCLKKHLVLSLILAASCLLVEAQPRNPCSDEQPYDYQTKLKGGYRIVFRTDSKEFKSLYLYRGSRKTAELAGTSCGLPHKNLGYVGADFTNYFVLVQSYGAGNPHQIQLIRKRDGKNMIKATSAWISADENRGLLTYSESDVPRPGDKFKVLNIRTFKVEAYPFPSDIFDEPEILYRITKVSVGSSRLKVSYRVGTQLRSKSYRRST